MPDKSQRPQTTARIIKPEGKFGNSIRATGSVQSLTRALWLLNCLAEHVHGLSLSEVARKVGLPTSTAHRLLTTLQNERYVRFEAERSVWLIGVQAFQVGASFMRSRDLAGAARPYMRRLMELSGETVNLAISDNGQVVYLAQVECQKVMRAITGPGGRAHMHNSAVGKAMLAWAPPETLERLVAVHGMPRETPKTIVTEDALAASLSKTRRLGYAVDNEENAIGMRCVSSAIFDENGCAMAAISVSGPVARILEKSVPVLGKEVVKIAYEIIQQLGGHLPEDHPRY